MNVSFDSLNRFEVPELFICSPGSELQDDGSLTNVLGSLVDFSDLEGVYNFNAMSELNFRAYKVPRGNGGDAGYTYRLYRALQNRRLIYVSGIGYFVINNVTNGETDNGVYKDVEAYSCEYEIQNKALPYIADGTYGFTQMIETLVSTLPLWVIGHVDSTVSARYRTFEDVDIEKNVYAFLQEDIQDAYECIILYDIIHREINIYDQNSYVRRTSIHLTKDDLISSVEIREGSEDLYTAISVTGENDLGIQAINPLGGNVIYNFDYYLDWMSDNLRSAVTQWKAALGTALPTYYTLNQTYYEKLEAKSDTQSEINRLEQQLALYKRCRGNIVAESGWDGTSGTSAPNPEDISSYNEAIVAAGGTAVTVDEDIQNMLYEIDGYIIVTMEDLSTANAALEAVNAEIASIESDISDIHDTVAITEFFTQEQYDELYHYIYEGEYTDEYVMITDSMDYGEQFAQMKILYDRAVAQLNRISQPRQEFDVDVDNFIFVKAFEDWADELETGVIINVELNDNADVHYIVQDGDTLSAIASSYGLTYQYLAEYNAIPDANLISVGQEIRIPTTDIASLFLTNFTVNYEDQTLSMTFGNRFDRFDLKSLYEDVLGSVKKNSNTLQYMKEILYPIKNGALDLMEEQIRNSRTLTKNLVMSADNEQVIIDDTGYTGRSLIRDGDNYVLDPRQVRITGKTMAFTDDAWDTCKVALGELVIGTDDEDQPITVYGVNAETIIGEMILGRNLEIYSDSGAGVQSLFDVTNGQISSYVSSNVQPSINALDSAVNDPTTGLVNQVNGLAGDLDDAESSLDTLTGRVTNAETNIFNTSSQLTQLSNGLSVTISNTIGTYMNGEDGESGYNADVNNRINTAMSNVKSVTTETNYTFNEEGLTIHKSGEELQNRIDNTGMYVQLLTAQGTEDVLTATNEGVDAMNLKSRQFLIVGDNSRFEDYPGADGARTGCFYIGPVA